jgi:hypothetical protein
MDALNIAEIVFEMTRSLLDRTCMRYEDDRSTLIAHIHHLEDRIRRDTVENTVKAVQLLHENASTQSSQRTQDARWVNIHTHPHVRTIYIYTYTYVAHIYFYT